MVNNLSYIEKFTKTIKLDFDALDNWKNKEGFPICSFIHVYEACGLIEVIKNNTEENYQLVPFDNILCNFYTLQRLKEFIKNNWECYSLTIKEDNKIIWTNDKYKQQKHYRRNLSKRVLASVNLDFANYCPGVDDDMEDNEIKFVLYEKQEEENKEIN